MKKNHLLALAAVAFVPLAGIAADRLTAVECLHLQQIIAEQDASEKLYLSVPGRPPEAPKTHREYVTEGLEKARQRKGRAEKLYRDSRCDAYFAKVRKQVGVE